MAISVTYIFGEERQGYFHTARSCRGNEHGLPGNVNDQIGRFS